MLQNGSIRPLRKLVYAEEFIGDTERRTAVYIDVHEDSSLGATHKLPAEVEFPKRSIAVYAGGSWGTALACQAARCYDDVVIYLRDTNIIEEIKNNRTNSKYLGFDVTLPDNIIPCNDLSFLLNKEVIIIAVPSSAFVEALHMLKNAGISDNVTLLVATKGFAKNPTGLLDFLHKSKKLSGFLEETKPSTAGYTVDCYGARRVSTTKSQTRLTYAGSLLSDKVKSILPDNPLAFIAGPNLAEEVAKNLLTSATIASTNIDLANQLAGKLQSRQFSITVTDCVVTMQVAAAVKNIIAIKSGWYDAKNYGQNAKAGLITGGLEEIKILSEAINGRLEDISVLYAPGILGDLVLTCYAKNSRNARFGYELGSQLDSDIDKFLNKNANLYLVEG